MIKGKAVPNGPRTGVPAAGEWPAWVPEAARNYLAHTEGGQTIRALAREAQVAPSTILRRVRRVESSRDDPLVDAALKQLSRQGQDGEPPPSPAVPLVPILIGGARSTLAREALPILRRLNEPRTVLAVAREMEKGVVVREGLDGDPQRLAVLERSLAEAMVLQDWIASDGPEGRINRYRITAVGRVALREALAEEAARDGDDASARASGAGRDQCGVDGEDARLRHMRSLLAESPLTALARRRDGQGAPFLGRELVAAGERLREDFELAERGPAGPPDWEELLRSAMNGAFDGPGPAGGPGAATTRVGRALADLGPGLAEAALRCCCLLEGLESFEARMGWSARSGKVVLRIALERLARHYAEAGRLGELIG